jgi:hypothetical protein
MEWVVIAIPRPLCPGRDPVPTVQEAGWAPGPVWKGAENLSPHRPASIEPQFWLRCPVSQTYFVEGYS